MVKTIALAAWRDEGRRRFGIDSRRWQFKCPSCGHVARKQDWEDAGAPPGAVAFSCIGRYTGDAEAAKAAAFKRAGGPCNYTSGGLFDIAKVHVVDDDGVAHSMFEFEGDDYAPPAPTEA